MTKEEKIQHKIDRSQRRRQKRYDATANKIARKRNAFMEHGFKVINNQYGVWEENGRMMQICSYEAYGTCEFPCNGDC